MDDASFLVHYEFRNLTGLRAFAYDPSISFVVSPPAAPSGTDDSVWVVVLAVLGCILLFGCALRSVRFRLSAR